MDRQKVLHIDKRYLMIPQSANVEVNRSASASRKEGHGEVIVAVDGRRLFSERLVIRGEKPWWWAALDLSPWQGMTMEVRGSITEDEQEAFDAISLETELKGMPDLYHEFNRPQFHFSYRHGVLGDPTAMVYYPPAQEWHMFTIHNPFRGREICWGHAVSSDLLHWEERSPIFRDPHWFYNGAGFVDTRNLLGLNRDGEMAIVLLTPYMPREHRPVSMTLSLVSMTVSIDGGRTFHDMNDLAQTLSRSDLPVNPIVPGTGDAPRLYWNPVANKFFLTHCRWGKQGDETTLTSLQYTSENLADWTRTYDFPLLIFDNWPGEGDANDVLELPLDGDETNRIVLIMCGRNGYALGRYSEAGLDNLAGQPLTSRDTIATGHYGYPIVFSGTPGGRGIIMYNVGNGRRGGIPNCEIGYKPNMSFPLELSLRTTPSGPRLYQYPIREIERLYRKTHVIGDLRVGDTPTSVHGPQGGLYHVQSVVEAGSAEEIDLTIMGYTITYNAGNGTIGSERDEWGPSARDGRPVITQEGGTIKVDMLIDRTSIEVFPNEGERYIYYGRLTLYEHKGDHFTFTARGGEGALRGLKVIEMDTIW